MKQLFSSLATTRRGDWSMKASSFDDQILIVGYNGVDCFVELFYDEEVAHNFIEGLYDQNIKTNNR